LKELALLSPYGDIEYGISTVSKAPVFSILFLEFYEQICDLAADHDFGSSSRVHPHNCLTSSLSLAGSE